MNKIIGYVVLRDEGYECELCFGPYKDIPKDGVLLWGMGFTMFKNRRRANRAIERTKKRKENAFSYRVIPVYKEPSLNCKQHAKMVEAQND